MTRERRAEPLDDDYNLDDPWGLGGDDLRVAGLRSRLLGRGPLRRVAEVRQGHRLVRKCGTDLGTSHERSIKIP